MSILINGTYLLKTQSLTLDASGGKIAVNTMSEGLVGGTDGTKTGTVSFTAAVPVSGPEADFFGMCQKGDYVTIQLPIGGKSFIGDGWFDTVSLSQSTDASTELNCSLTCEFKPLV